VESIKRAYVRQILLPKYASRLSEINESLAEAISGKRLEDVKSLVRRAEANLEALDKHCDKDARRKRTQASLAVRRVIDSGESVSRFDQESCSAAISGVIEAVTIYAEDDKWKT
jgi:hypothetical protein